MLYNDQSESLRTIIISLSVLTPQTESSTGASIAIVNPPKPAAASGLLQGVLEGEDEDGDEDDDDARVDLKSNNGKQTMLTTDLR